MLRAVNALGCISHLALPVRGVFMSLCYGIMSGNRRMRSVLVPRALPSGDRPGGGLHARAIGALYIITVPIAALSQEANTATTHQNLIDERRLEAEGIAQDLSERLKLLEMEFDLPDDLAERALDSLNNGRVRELLNAGETDLAAYLPEEERYPGGLYLFASFSMPQPSLKAMLGDAADLGIPVVFNGFVDNSVIATEQAVRAIYKDSDISDGFIIDPTLFTRFEVTAVPTLISTTVNLDVCETQGCGEEAVPAHDRVAGNAPLQTLLTIIAKGDGDHAAPAQFVLMEDE